MQRSVQFGPPSPPFSGLSRTVLIASVGLYITQLIAESWLHLPVVELLAWWPLGSDQLRPWQPLSAWLLNGPDPLAAFFTWLAIWFFLPPVEETFGSRGLSRAAATTISLSLVLGFVLQLLGAIAGQGPFYGPGPLLTTLTVLFGFSRPNATILLFFILPVRAIWIAWATGLLALLYFLATRTLGSALILTGWIAGWLWLQGISPGALRKLWLRWRYERLHRRLRDSQVIDLDERRRRSADKDGPIYH